MTPVQARTLVAGTAEGPALVSTKPLSFLGDIDILTGTIVNHDSPIVGQSVAGTVLVLEETVGSAGSWRFLYQLVAHETNPKAIITMRLPDSSLVQGAILCEIPMVYEPRGMSIIDFDAGDLIFIDGAAGLIEIQKKRR